MGSAVGDGAAGGQAALAADCVRDRATLGRVAVALAGQPGGWPGPVPEPGYDPAAPPMARRTCAELGSIRRPAAEGSR
jgi:hypothetical protein